MWKSLAIFLATAAACGTLGYLIGHRKGLADRQVDVVAVEQKLDRANDDFTRMQEKLRREARDLREKEFADYQRELEAQRDRRQLEDRLNIRIVGAAQDFAESPLLQPNEKYHGEAVKMSEVVHALAVVTNELQLYPDPVIIKMMLKRIVIAKHLRTGPFQLGGFSTGLGVIYLDVGRTDEEIARTFHHEMFHLIDRFLGERNWMTDREWAALNPEDMPYTESQELLSEKQWLNLDLPKRKGYISAYARWTPTEDKAEMFEWMAYRPNALDFREAHDDVLKAKRKLLTKRLAAFHPAFADQFWAQARSRESARNR